MTIHELVSGARDRFIKAGINERTAVLDSEVLARNVLGWDAARFLADRHEPASSAFLLNYEQSVARRVRREPVSYILGKREFWSLDFEVTPDVLIPRHETELIVEEALVEGRLDRSGRLLIYDIGTGSGVLAVALAREFPNARVVATDLSANALRVARRNAERHGVADRMEFIETSYLDGLTEPAHLIASNPPYVPSVSRNGLVPEVRDYEPSVAVFAGNDGLDGPRAVIAGAPAHLVPGGWLIMEFGYGQDDDVSRLVGEQAGLSLVTIRGDIQEIPRTIVARRT